MSDWVRLWSDMPTDPKWRVIARRANRPISEVLSVFNFMMVNAGEWSHRGTLEGWNDEVVATALDMDFEDVVRIREAMQGLVLDGDNLSGWDKRQTKRNDESTQRVREHRERLKRDVTQCNAPETTETPEEKRIDKKDTSSLRSDVSATPKACDKNPEEILLECLSRETAIELIAHRKAKRSPLTVGAAKGLVKSFRSYGDAEVAAREMMAQGWTGFKPEWMQNQKARAGPQRSNGKDGMARIYAKIQEQKHAGPIESGGNSGDVRRLPLIDDKRDSGGVDDVVLPRNSLGVLIEGSFRRM